MAANITTISSVTPVLLSPATRPTVLTIVNLDSANSVWVAGDAVGSATAIELTAGSTLPWDSYQPLYAFVKNAANPVQTLTYDNSGTFSNGVAVANALKASGLTAAAIASQIQSSGLTPANIASQILSQGLTPSAIAQQINLAGVPAIDVPNVIYSSRNTLTSTWGTGMQNVAAYASLRIHIEAVTTNGQPFAFYVSFADDNLNAAQRFIPFSVPANGITDLVVPITGPWFQVSASGQSTAFSSSFVQISASYRNAPSITYQVNTAGSFYPTTNATLGNGAVIEVADFFSWTNAGSGVGTLASVVYPLKASKNGRCHLVAINQGGSGSFTIGVRDAHSGLYIYGNRTVGVGTILEADFNIGLHPIAVELSESAVGQSAFTLTTI